MTPEERLRDPRHDPKVRNLAGRELHTRPDGISETHIVDIKHVAAGGKLYDSDQLRLQRLMAYDQGKRQAIVMRTEPGTPVASFPEPSGPLAEKSGEVFLRGDDGFYQWMVNDETGKAGWVAAPPGHVASTLGGSL